MAAKVYGPTNLDTRLSASLEVLFNNKVIDNIFNRYPTLKKLWDDRKETDGGESINQPITFLINNNVKALATPFEEVDTTPQNAQTTANDAFRIYTAPISVSDVEIDENRGRKIFPLVKQKLNDAMWSMRRELNTDIWAAAQTGGTLNTFQEIISASGTIHKIATASFWQAVVIGSGSFATQGISDMRKAVNQASIEGDMPPTMIVTDRATHERYENEGQAVANIYLPPTTDEHDMNLGFNTLRFRGIPVFFDLSAPADKMFFVNTNDTKLVVSKHHNFRVGEFIRPHNALAQTAIVSMRAQLFTGNRRLNAVMNSITD